MPHRDDGWVQRWFEAGGSSRQRTGSIGGGATWGQAGLGSQELGWACHEAEAPSQAFAYKRRWRGGEGAGSQACWGGDRGSGDKSTAWNCSHARMSFGRSPKWKELEQAGDRKSSTQGARWSPHSRCAPQYRTEGEFAKAGVGVGLRGGRNRVPRLAFPHSLVLLVHIQTTIEE